MPWKTVIGNVMMDSCSAAPAGMMPAGAPQVAYAVDKLAGNVTTPVNLAGTYTNAFAAAANLSGHVPPGPA